ncbi:hypothetical protein TNCV_1805441 [Trichonephila clavipes]|nr:hypothetical protein TNCV_1805441 [Trichonephila clavipes]
MWFKIILPNKHYPLAAMFGKDGKIYFRLEEIGVLLGRSKVQKFVKHFDTFVIEDKCVAEPQGVSSHGAKVKARDSRYGV